ncbi:hypothetical protein BHE74_00029606 [Ensete ventricosum]|nr:hypothetical protein BHE74_00029606 [Ensete ventricosum]RZS13897.1 hypothetical protein BHM03_00045597 [Ensete ventricosum]
MYITSYVGQPLTGWLLAAAPCGLATGCRHLRALPCTFACVAPFPQATPLRAATPTGYRPLRAGLGRGLAVGRSYIPVFQIRIEKMKVVKRSPL